MKVRVIEISSESFNDITNPRSEEKYLAGLMALANAMYDCVSSDYDYSNKYESDLLDTLFAINDYVHDRFGEDDC